MLPRPTTSLALTLCCLLASTSASFAADASRTAREKREVQAVFAEVSKDEYVGAGGMSHMNQPCALDLAWPSGEDLKYMIEEAKKSPFPMRKPLVTPQEAIDPNGRKPGLFCDVHARSKRNEQEFKERPGDDNARISVTKMEYSYPAFNSKFTRAFVLYRSFAGALAKNGKTTGFVQTVGWIDLWKRKGRWKLEVHEGSFAETW